MKAQKIEAEVKFRNFFKKNNRKIIHVNAT
jgi:hypothetical protein